MTEHTAKDENPPEPLPKPDPPEPATAADEPQASASGHRATTYPAKVRKWLSAKWLRWTLGAIMAGALAALGASLYQSTAQGAHHLISGSGKRSESAAVAKPLGVTSEADYSYGNAVALGTGVSSGLGYADLLAGPTDTDPQNSWSALLARYGGAPIGELHVDFVLTGQDTTNVRVTNVEIQRVGPVMPPLSGTYIPIPHGGAQAAYQFQADMDAQDPMLTRVPNGQTFPDFNVQLSDGEQLTLSVNFLAMHYSCRFVLQVTYLTGTRAHILKVEAPNGRPFAVTGQSASYKVVYATNYPEAGGYRLTS